MNDQLAALNRIATERLGAFADLGASRIVVSTLSRAPLDADPGPLGQPVTIGLVAGGCGDVVLVTDYWPEPVFRDTLDYIVRERHEIFSRLSRRKRKAIR